ncbi:MAG: biotin--[acetyl-CoA-carboxylase] ligase [Saprospiraceae bacterium]|nr:biotin--[acetyl-CoA-carboxylase] ligase [Pyrinomonadaceae bacterium]
MNFKILRFEIIDSTNTEAIKQAKLGADEGVCIVAREQTAGRGRHGRTWNSAAANGLYFSIVLRPSLKMRFLPLVTLMMGVAVHDTLIELGIKPDIKWVNDILVNEKKISGILAETVDTSKGLAVIVGVGINLRSSNFPPEIADIATSVKTEIGKSITSEEISVILTRFLGYFYDILSGENGPHEIRSEWQKRSSYAVGKNVRIVLENEAITGVTDGLEVNGALRLKTPKGELKVIQAGDVEQLRPNPSG